MTNTPTWDIKPIALLKNIFTLKMSLCQIIALACLFTIGFTGLLLLVPVSEAHPSKVKHVKYYTVDVCFLHGNEFNKTLIRTSYYILEDHEEDPLHTSGSCSINHDVSLITDEILLGTHIWCPHPVPFCRLRMEI
ncbi:hypothetical protein C6499_13760 [Candidatus Poribacteria bacterium]|nr:MAG: hypothetical protein C6499_13760 [Candidatus Poribacteria bacterium]